MLLVQMIFCDMIGCVKLGQNEVQILCVVCVRWSYFLCVYVIEVLKEGFICLICIVRYEVIYLMQKMYN